MSEKQFKQLKKNKDKFKIKVKGIDGTYFALSFTGDDINVQFEGPVPEPYHYKDCLLVEVTK